MSFYIKDNGIGIPADQHENISKIFKTLDQNAVNNGVRPSVCKKIEELQGGKITFHSISGQSPIFYYTI
ncbi:ATP-binding protein [Flavobacterium tiangeerense]|uniref:ATP-binding protein n=1 Tax=Flavobacterium tiangeerense TaxID=459471 RepID=UPI00374482E5